MTAEIVLCDGRLAVGQALEDVKADFPFTLRCGFAHTVLPGDGIVWGEWSNVSTDCPVVDELAYQVIVLAGNMDRLRILCAGVNEVLLRLGLKRIYTSPDGFEDNRYTKTLRFGRRVDKRTMRLID